MQGQTPGRAALPFCSCKLAYYSAFGKKKKRRDGAGRGFQRRVERKGKREEVGGAGERA